MAGCLRVGCGRGSLPSEGIIHQGSGFSAGIAPLVGNHVHEPLAGSDSRRSSRGHNGVPASGMARPPAPRTPVRVSVIVTVRRIMQRSISVTLQPFRCRSVYSLIAINIGIDGKLGETETGAGSTF